MTCEVKVCVPDLTPQLLMSYLALWLDQPAGLDCAQVLFTEIISEKRT
jgi:hypothetical protein